MKLSHLLKLHKKNSPLLSLPKNLGDGFLLQNNFLYRIIREKAQQLNYHYSSTVNEFYLALPLSQLEAVLNSKSIPYSDNVSVLETVQDVATWDDITDNLKRNNIFHESCHAVARSLSTPLFKNASAVPHSNVVRLLVEESFANACELLGIVDAEDPAHRIFYEANSYIFMYEDRFQLKKLLGLLGYPRTLKFLILSYLFSNFLHERITDNDFERILALIGLGQNQMIDLKVLRSTAKIAFELNPRFRWVTTTFYLKLNGLAYTASQLNEIDFLSLLESNSPHLNLVDQLSQFVSENASY
ncbi:MAG: hypothetical protein JNL11_18985 [Bdellovibrionaceae bacterium]|nr:hypothetical protein [Pseudobdellovibrionaceae bacterium]